MSKKAITNFIELLSLNNNQNWSSIVSKEFSKEVIKYLTQPSDLLSNFEFIENVCHRCNQIMPKYLAIDPMYNGNKFVQRCNPYIKQKFIELGYSPVISEKDYLPTLLNLFPSEWLEHIDSRKELDDMIENIVRDEFGLHKKGEYWLSETYMSNLIKRLYPTEKIIRHHRPDWLEGLELDVFIPSKKIGFEYNGLQHYKPVKYFGGPDKFKTQIKRDKRKKDLCKKNRIRLVVIKYDEDLTLELLKEKINDLSDY